jgi:hypothetical protein
MLERMGLRAENALFLDDNHLNLEEVAFFNEGISCVDGTLDLRGLLDLRQLQGKPDAARTRLAQYKLLEGKLVEQRTSGLSNEDFLRQSGIQVRIVTDLADKMDRVLEILNRTNQLNFTKVRANTPDERAGPGPAAPDLRMHAGLVHVRDRYGDYGIVGFFCVRTKFSGTTVHHFAFSCRTLNMGVEQWVWEHLGRPEFKVAGPVAGTLDADDRGLDHRGHGLRAGASARTSGAFASWAVATCCRCRSTAAPTATSSSTRWTPRACWSATTTWACSSTRANQALAHSRALTSFAGWTLADMRALDRSLAESDLILLSMYFSVPTDKHLHLRGRGVRRQVTGPPSRPGGS